MRGPGRRFPPLGLGLAALGIILAVAVLLGERGASDGNRARTAPAAIGACLSRSAKLAVTRPAVASATATAERAGTRSAGRGPRRGGRRGIALRPAPTGRALSRPRRAARRPIRSTARGAASGI